MRNEKFLNFSVNFHLKNDFYKENFSQLVSEYCLINKLLFKSHLKH